MNLVRWDEGFVLGCGDIPLCARVCLEGMAFCRSQASILRRRAVSSEGWRMGSEAVLGAPSRAFAVSAYSLFRSWLIVVVVLNEGVRIERSVFLWA